MYKRMEKSSDKCRVEACCKDWTDDYWIMNIQIQTGDRKMVDNFIEWMGAEDTPKWGITFTHGSEENESRID